MINATHKFNSYCVSNGDHSNVLEGVEVEVTERCGMSMAGFDVLISARYLDVVAAYVKAGDSEESARECAEMYDIEGDEEETAVILMEADEAEQLIAI